MCFVWILFYVIVYVDRGDTTGDTEVDKVVTEQIAHDEYLVGLISEAKDADFRKPLETLCHQALTHMGVCTVALLHHVVSGW